MTDQSKTIQNKNKKSLPNIITGYNFDRDSKIIKAELATLACQDRKC